jgi:uncharacterized protein (UPF0276 family)
MTFEHEIADHRDQLDLLEVIPDRFFGQSNDPIFDISSPPSIVFHSLNLSLGSDQELDSAYVDDICELARRLKPLWASDHLAVSQIGDADLGHLSPVRWSTAAVARIAGKVAYLRERLRIPFLVENIAYYFEIPGADIGEAQLLCALVEASGCELLLDLNNVAVNAANHGFDPYAYLRSFPLHAVREIHVAGHRRYGAIYLDSHDRPVSDLVWDMLRFVSGRISTVNVILERDDDVPAIAELMGELTTARTCVREGKRRSAVCRPIPT